MRLTLRTLLAYLDDILDPQDTEQLRSKIEESEFATSLVHQIRGSVRRLRLDAPALDSEGIGSDLNSVAEYLDNVLPPDQVPALEKACLDSEIQLGEVASCHQVLTLVLGEPANVNDQMRQRAYSVAPTAAHSEIPPSQVPQVTAHSAHPSVPSQGKKSPAQRVPSAVDETRPRIDETIVSPEQQTQAPLAPTTRERKERTPHTLRVPSTRETWRAQAQEGLQDDSQTVAPVVETYRSSAVDGRGTHPQALEGKGSWVRPAFVTGLVAILILAGLLFATAPVDNTFFSRWFGTNTTPVADHSTASPVLSVGEVPAEDDPIEVELVEPGQRDEWIEGEDSDFQSLPTFDTPEAPQLADALPDEGSELLQPAEVSGESRFSERPLELNNLSSDSNAGDLNFAASPSSSESGPEQFGATDAERILPHDTRKETVSATPTLTPSDDYPMVPPAPAPLDKNATRPDGPNTPRVGDLALLVDPDVDLRPAEISPPVASPAADSSSPGDSLPTVVIPEETVAPDPAPVPEFPPTTLRGADQLLLVFNSDIQDWQRIQADAPIPAGSVLMGMPAFQAELEIGDSLVCTTVNSTRVALGPEADLTLQDGQLLIRNDSDGDLFGLRFGERRFEIEMPKSGSTVAVGASRLRVPGADPNELPHSLLRICAIKHDIVVRFQDKSYEAKEGGQVVAFDSFEPRIEERAKHPQWATQSATFGGDKHAIRTWKRELDQISNIRIWLQERAQRRYSERALAARCLAEIDEFDAIISALNDRDQHAFWEHHFNTLRRALTRGDETVNRLQLELDKAHGDRAAFMMDMIRGFSEQQLASGGAAKLVRYLNHKSLDHRVLAIQNLKDITGYSLAFRAEQPEARRQGVVRKWMGRLSTGRVRYKKTPEVVALLESFARPD